MKPLFVLCLAVPVGCANPQQKNAQSSNRSPASRANAAWDLPGAAVTTSSSASACR